MYTPGGRLSLCVVLLYLAAVSSYAACMPVVYGSMYYHVGRLDREIVFLSHPREVLISHIGLFSPLGLLAKRATYVLRRVSYFEVLISPS